MEETIVGRETELARLFRMAEDPASAGPVLLLTGDAGMGKTALLEAAASRAESLGVRVLRARGTESESGLAFSALHQLLRPAAEAIGELPHGQQEVLPAAFGTGSTTTGPPTASPDLMTVGIAVTDLLAAMGERQPVLVVLDDVQWCDRGSLDVLSFAGRRLAGAAVTMLVAAGSGADVPGFGRQVPELALDPLDDAAAGELLDRRPERPTGRSRARILDQAAGNPLALVELTRAAGHDRAAGSSSVLPSVLSAGPMPLTGRLERIFGARTSDLPAPTRRALLLLAAMDSGDSAIAVTAVAAGQTAAAPGEAGAGRDVWLPAERAGLVRRTGHGVHFTHPLVRSAVYQGATFDARRDAHRALAELMRDEPDRYAWHLAAACPCPGTELSTLLEQAAGQARRRGGPAGAAATLQRAAELAPRPADSARLLVEAASAAVLTGDLRWVEELAAAARARTGDTALLASATVQVGRLTVLTGQHNAAFSGLVRAAEHVTDSLPGTALELLASAAVARYYSGEDAQRRRLDEAVRQIPEDGPQAWLRTWVDVVSDPARAGHARRTSLLQLIDAEQRGEAKDRPGAQQGELRPERLAALGIAAWLLDEAPRAARAFDEALDHGHGRGVLLGSSSGSLSQGLGGAVAWAYVELGRWDRAREASARMIEVGTAAGLDHAVACALAVDAVVLAFRGDSSGARAQAERALTLVDPLESRSVSVYARRALAAAAAAEGAYDVAYDQLRLVFTPDGDPVHYHASYPALADLAAASVRIGRSTEAAAIVERAAEALTGNASPRLRGLLDRARGLLAGTDSGPGRGSAARTAAADAERHFRAALANDALEHLPFERAQTLLDLAEWLRRRRRITEARAPLAEALDVFRRLGARPWIERAQAESRAAGLDVVDPVPDTLAELSPQQQQIVRLAAGGLTNREIGEKLFISPRTVSSHLHRTFPRLGVTARSQLRDLVERAPRITVAG